MICIKECERVLQTGDIEQAQEQGVTLLYDQVERWIESVQASPSVAESYFRRLGDVYWRSLVERTGRGFDPDAYWKKLDDEGCPSADPCWQSFLERDGRSIDFIVSMNSQGAPDKTASE